MRVLVTGAAGFVGYAVAALLVEQGHEVTGLTRSGATALPKGVARLEGDLRTPETLPRSVAEVDGVCHLAGLTKVRQSRTAPVDYWHTNVGGTLAILDRLASAHTGRLVLASTCTVYGEQAEQPISETAAMAPTNPYATSKLAADQAAADLTATGAIGAISLRAVNVAGALPRHPDRDTTRLIPQLLAVQQGRHPSWSSTATAPRSATSCTWPTWLPPSSSPSMRASQATGAPTTSAAAAPAPCMMSSPPPRP
jgi:UDP-glucose 4-epimerase